MKGKNLTQPQAHFVSAIFTLIFLVAAVKLHEKTLTKRITKNRMTKYAQSNLVG